MPKAELHVHLEGTAPPALIRRIAARNGIPVPDGRLRGRGRVRAGRDFLALPAHLRPRGQRHPHRRRTTATSPTSTCRAAPREGAIYVELIASPDHAAAAGLTDADHFAAIAQGIDDARADHGIEARIIVDRDPQLRRRARRGVARSHADDRHPYVVGFNLAGDEAGFAARRRSRARTRSRPAPGSAARSTPASMRAPSRCAGARAAGDAHLATACGRSRIRRSWRSSPSAARARGVPDARTSPRRLSELRGPSDSVRCATPGCGSRSAPTTLPISACSIGGNTPWRVSAWALMRSSCGRSRGLAVEAGFADDAVKEALSARLDFPGGRGSV